MEKKTPKRIERIEGRNLTSLTLKHFFRLKWEEIVDSTFGLTVIIFLALFLVPLIIGSATWLITGNPAIFADCTPDHYKAETTWLFFSKNSPDPVNGHLKCDVFKNDPNAFGGKSSDCTCTLAIENPNRLDLWDRWATGAVDILIILALWLITFMIKKFIEWIASNWALAEKLAYEEWMENYGKTNDKTNGKSGRKNGKQKRNR